MCGEGVVSIIRIRCGSWAGEDRGGVGPAEEDVQGYS